MTTQNPSVHHVPQTTQSDELAGGAPPTALGPVAAGHTPAGCTPPTGESTPSAGFQTVGRAAESKDPLSARPDHRGYPEPYGPIRQLNLEIAALGSKHTPIEDEAGTVTGWAEPEDVRIGNKLDNGPKCCQCNRRAENGSRLCSDCEAVQRHFSERRERLLERKRRHNAEIVAKSPVIGNAARDLMLLDGPDAYIGGDEDLALHITDEGVFLPVSFCMRLLSNIAHEVRTTAFELDAHGCPTQESVDTLIRDAAAKLLDVGKVPELADPIRTAIDEAA